MIEEEEVGLTFSDADFERRYSSKEASGAISPSCPRSPGIKTSFSPAGPQPQ